jgi:acyl-CoA synthetase (AMP-forming)/AMP-acid ligase II
MIFRSPYPDVTIPDVPLASFVLRHADRLADKPALIDASSGQTLTYGALAEATRAVAAGLAHRGFRRGDVFAIYAPSCLDYAVALLAVASLGGIVTTVNHLATADELARQLDDAGADFLLTTPHLLDCARPALARTAVRDVFVLGEAAWATPFASLPRAGEALPDVQIEPGEDVVMMPYSSGTTGLPKGVMLTHRNLVANLLQADVPLHRSERDVVFCVPPFFHCYGVLMLTWTLAAGATLVFLPRFELAAFLRTVQDERVTHAYLAPPNLLALANEPVVDEFDLSALRLIVSGAAPLGADLMRRCEARLTCKVIQAYGLTEASPGTHAPFAAGPWSKPDSIGACIPNTECKVVDVETGAELSPNQPGELWIRGPQVMRGYLNRPEATAQTVTPDGWLRTGDIGYADEDGDFYIVDRLKELIKYKAYQVAPAELEAVLLSHPMVADAAVIPSPDAAAGEVPKAFVVLKGEACAEELMAFVAARVAPYKKVRRIEFTDQIPKSPSGKILRRVLVERERECAAVALPV